MSAATETPIVNEPHVATHGGYVDAAENYTKHHSSAVDTATPVAAAPATTASEPTSAVTNGDTTEEKAGKKKAEVTATPITSGVLGYKAPGPLAFRFKKHHVWLGDDAVPTKDLHSYLRGEKPEIAHPIAAHASQTGKGLLFIAKDEHTKKSPMSVIHLGDAVNMAKEGTDKISFRLEGNSKHKHTFQAATQDERNGWLVAIESAAEHAKTSRKGVEGSEGYQNSMKELKNEKTVPAVAGASAVAGAAGAGTVAGAHHKERPEPTEPVEPVVASRPSSSDDEKKKSKSKSRSQSRNKRASIFDTLRGKKEEKDVQKEVKKEEKAEHKEIEKEGKAEEKEIKKEEKAIAAEHKHEEKAEKKEIKQEEKAEEKAVKHEEKAEEKAAKEAKKEEAAAEAKHHHETEAGVAGGAAVAAGGAAAVAAEEKNHKTHERSAVTDSNKPIGTPRNTTEQPKSKRRSGIFAMFDKVKSPSSEKKEEEVMPATTAAPTSKDIVKDEPVSAAEPTAATTTPVATTGLSAVEKENTRIAPTTNTAAAATAPLAATNGTAEPTANGASTTPLTNTTTPDAKANRRQSWFGRFGSMRSKTPRDSSANRHDRKESTAMNSTNGTPAKAALVDETATTTDAAPSTMNPTTEAIEHHHVNGNAEVAPTHPHLSTTQRLMGIDGTNEAKPLDNVVANGTPVAIGDVTADTLNAGNKGAEMPASQAVSTSA